MFDVCFFKQKTAYEMRISDWSSDVCSSDLNARQEYREDRRDWQRDRRYANWRAPFQYHRFVAGNRLNGRYYAPAYRLNYDARWRIPRAGAGLSYIRHYDHLLLVNVRSGAVVRVYRGFFCSAGDRTRVVWGKRVSVRGIF